MPKVSVVRGDSSNWVTDADKLEAIIDRIQECIDDPDAGDHDIEVLQNMVEFIKSRNCFSQKQLNYLSQIEDYIERTASREMDTLYDNDLPF